MTSILKLILGNRLPESKELLKCNNENTGKTCEFVLKSDIYLMLTNPMMPSVHKISNTVENVATSKLTIKTPERHQ